MRRLKVNTAESRSHSFLRTGSTIWLIAAFCIAIPIPFDCAAQSDDPRSSIPDVTDQQWVDLSGQTRPKSDDITLLRILNRLPNISDTNWNNYAAASRSTRLNELIVDPMRYVSQVHRIEGIAKQVQQVPMAPSRVDEFEFDHYFMTRVETKKPAQVVVISRSVPSSWPIGKEINEPVACFGYFLMKGTSGDGEFPVFASSELAWYPDPDQSKLPLTPGQIALSKSGFDIAQLDRIENNTLTAILPEEETAFFEMMSATSKLSRNDQSAVETWDLIELMRSPDEYKGRLVTLSGRVRRVTPVKVSEAPLRNQFGLDQYYQLDVFVSLGKRRLRVTDDDGNEVNIQGSFGVTVILSELPDQVANPEHRHPKISVPAFFFKQWRHTTSATADVSMSLRRPNPIFIGVPDQLQMVDTRAPSHMGTLMALFFGVIVVVVAVLLWWSNRSPHHTRRPAKGDVDLSKL